MSWAYLTLRRRFKESRTSKTRELRGKDECKEEKKTLSDSLKQWLSFSSPIFH